MSKPNPNEIYPLKNGYSVKNAKPLIKNPNIIVGDFTYISDEDFESHVQHFYPFNNDKLIIGKFCQIAHNVKFIMNGANHKHDCATSFPFYIFKGWDQKAPDNSQLPIKGDTIIGNDVWIGENVTILPGIHIGDGAIIGINSTVSKNVDPYTIVGGDPIKLIRNRFDEELTNLLLKLKWWDKSIDEINKLIPILTSSKLDEVKIEIRKLLH